MSLKLSGFTLIELMIVIVIVAIVAAVAIPSYNSYVDRGKRAEARTALLDIAARQERYYSNKRQYTNKLYGPATAKDHLRFPGSGCKATGCPSENGYYTLSVTAIGSNTQTFKATATPAGWTDDKCGVLGIDETGAKTQSLGDRALCWGK